MRDAGPERFYAALAAVAGAAGAFVATERQDALLAAVSLAALAGVLAWYLAARRFDRRLRLGEDAVTRHERELVETRTRLQRELDEERQLRERLERCREKEHEWERELRRQVIEAHQEMGLLGDPRDLRTLVLRVAVELVGAKKGVLLARTDGDGDGHLDLVAQEGFRGDASRSKLVQRFAHEVIERDEIVKEPDCDDPELDNLVAIPIYMHDDFGGVVVVGDVAGGVDGVEDDVLLSLGDQAGAVLHNARLSGELRDAYVGTVQMLADALEAKDPFLRTHGDDATRYVTAVAIRLGLAAREREELVFASLLHDVGKIGITERILLKPAELSPEERSIVELHPRIGFRIVQQVPALAGIAAAVLHHHERFDGSGYPGGLRGQDIPLEARLVAIADAFSAMTSDRPYRGACGVEEAIAELERCAGEQFDPELVRLFVEEVRADPPREGAKGLLATALADAEIELRRADNEPLLGFGSAARTDNLTQLYSHRHCREAVDAEAATAAVQGRPFAIVLVELVDLEQLNADSGYAAGDEAIRVVADAVQAAAADCGGTACRYSGSKLLVLAPNTGTRGAERVKEEIGSALDSGPRVRCACVVWRSGESGGDVLARAALELATTHV
jgi:diguanylate cyclase (GGDEF)-like protein